MNRCWRPSSPSPGRRTPVAAERYRRSPVPEANVHPDDVQGLRLVKRLQTLQKEFALTADPEKGRQWTVTFDELRRLVESHSVLTDDERSFLRNELQTPAYSLVPRSTESIPEDQRPAVGEICLSAAVPEPPPEMMIPAPQLRKVSEIDEQPKLRIGHFQYPDLSRAESFFAGRIEGAGSRCGPATPVVLRGKGKPCIVLGVEKPKLTAAQYDVIDAILRHVDGLSKDSLVCQSGHKGAVDILRRLAKRDEDWGRVISLAETTGGGYRIVDPR